MYLFKGRKINNVYFFKFRRERSVERKGIKAKFCSNWVIIFENTLTDVVEALEFCDRRWLFLGKEERSKNEELNVTGICSSMKRSRGNKYSPP